MLSRTATVVRGPGMRAPVKPTPKEVTKMAARAAADIPFSVALFSKVRQRGAKTLDGRHIRM
jgi:hypothetical protein